MRETLGQLERIIKEERRELAWSRSAMEQQKAIAELKTNETDLEALVRDQKLVVNDTKEAAKKEGDDAKKGARAASRERETGVRKAAAGLAADPAVRQASSRLSETGRPSSG